MAVRFKLKLPSFRVTQRSTTGEIKHRLTPRGCTSEDKGLTALYNCGDATVTEPPASADPGSGARILDDISGASFPPVTEPSLHSLAQKALVGNWNKIRPDILRTAIECNAIPPKQKCMLCSADNAIYRCLKCAPWAHYCSLCFGDAHRRTNLFHTGEVWEVCCSYSNCIHNN